MLKTKGQIESEISDAVTKFEKEYMGRGPLETKTYIIEDMVLVRLKKVLTPAELRLSSLPDPNDGRNLIKRVRISLLEQGRPILEDAVKNILGVEIRSLHTDISTLTGERIIIFSLEKPPKFAEKNKQATT